MYYDPFLIEQKLGEVVYKLQLSAGSLIHSIFHVSLLKKKVGAKFITCHELSKLGIEGQFLIELVAILNQRTIKKKE